MLWLYTAKNSTNGFELGVLSDITPFDYVAISDLNQINKTFLCEGNSSFYFGAGNKLAVTGSTGNDGVYTIVSVVYDDGHTIIEVAESIPSSAINGSMYQTYLVDQTEFAITGVNTGTKTFTVAGDHDDIAGYIGVVGSTGNDRCYTVVSATFDTDHTDIVVSEAIASAVVDGGIRQANDTINVYHVISGVNDMVMDYITVDSTYATANLTCGNIVCRGIVVFNNATLTADSIDSTQANVYFPFGNGGTITVTGSVRIGGYGNFDGATAVIGGDYTSTSVASTGLCINGTLTVGGNVDAFCYQLSSCISDSIVDVGGDLTVHFEASSGFCGSSTVTVGGKITIILEAPLELNYLSYGDSSLTAKSIYLDGNILTSGNPIKNSDAIDTKRLEVGTVNIKEDVLGTGLM